MSKLDEEKFDISDMPEVKDLTHTLAALHMALKESGAIKSDGEMVMNFSLTNSETGDVLKYNLVVKEIIDGK